MKSEVSSKKKEPKRDNRTRWKAYSAKKVGPANAAPARPATTALAPFPTDDHKAARHIQGNTQIKKYRLGTVSKKFKSFEYKENKIILQAILKPLGPLNGSSYWIP